MLVGRGSGTDLAAHQGIPHSMTTLGFGSRRCRPGPRRCHYRVLCVGSTLHWIGPPPSFAEVARWATARRLCGLPVTDSTTSAALVTFKGILEPRPTNLGRSRPFLSTQRLTARTPGYDL